MAVAPTSWTNRAVGMLAGPRGGRPRLIVRTIIRSATSFAAARPKPNDYRKSKPSQVLSAAVARDSVRTFSTVLGTAGAGRPRSILTKLFMICSERE